ncbi:hypothetical protein NEMBOFW57_004098 [Staphylotrichum longicolle]|uniref:Transcription factor domain-containing protein n=1 Tax=Staphylotrichum longicolle TaxID=669026 RepID=A0AAD4F6S5_9PEZI|nr:hypothetical protein NEMBOFW57_004098 [Staphylotrichum longicolle]
MPPAQKTSQTDTNPGHQVIGFVPPASPRQSRGSFAQERRTESQGTPTLPNETPGPFFTIPREDGTRFTIPVQDTAKFAAFVQTLVNRELADKVIPSDTDWQTMRDLYLAKIHPIFPIYDKSTLMDLPKETGLRQLIQASVCLAASTDPEVHNLLRFKSYSAQATNSEATLSFDDYSREVATFITRRLTELQEGQQIPLTHQIQVMAVTCLYWQPTGPAERFEPLNLYGKLVSLVHTHGVHLGVLARTPAEGGAGASGSRIFKCLYALDRLLGTISARPLMFHNIDLIEVPRPDTQDPPIFRLFIALILLLDQVIELYRPQPKVHYIDIPVYERMALEAGAQHEPESLLGISHSTDRILDVIRGYKLSPMPFVPYALTLSLSVAYRKWRFSRLPMFRTRGGADFKKVLGPVQEMGAIWSSARINGQLGQAVMLKLDRNEILNKKRTKRTTDPTGTGRGRTLDDNQELPARGTNTPLASIPGHASLARNFISPNPTCTATILPSHLDRHLDRGDRSQQQRYTASKPPTTPTTSPSARPDDAIPLPGDLLSQPTGLDETSPLTGVSDGNLDEFLVDDDALFRSWDPRFAQSVDFSFSSILDPGNPFAWPEYCTTDYMS